MTAPRVYKTEAVVLKRFSLGEADRILTLYTPNLGKLHAIAKGVRRTKSRLGGHVELFTRSALMLAHGQNLDVLTGAQTLDSFLPLRDDLQRTSWGIYAIELVEQFTADQVENFPLYRLLVETLHRLCDAPDGELVLRYFELQLLRLVGFQPQLQRCVLCSERLTPTMNGFSPQAGGMLCPSCIPPDRAIRRLSPNTLKVLRFLQSSDYPGAVRLRLTDPLHIEVAGALREYIRFHLEHEPRSLSFLDTLRRQNLIHLPG
ncbi:MAG: DNA repair protein RecO [Chloroflexota bacterium]|nr:MAG: DNA repair protein RecO [Chloroflexota bacterium]